MKTSIVEMAITYKDALLEDLPLIVNIYNSTVASRMVTADTEPVSVESRIDWFHKHSSAKRPLWLMVNEEQVVVGWISLQSFYGRPAYNSTVEISIYIDEKFRGRGVGKQALEYCIKSAPQFEIKTLLGFIFSHNQPSLTLFKSLGFESWATLPNVAVLDGVETSLQIVGKRVG